jgi:hypothetical protein
MARYFKAPTTTTAAVAIQVNNYGNTDFLGLYATNTTAAAYYIKLAWVGAGNVIPFPSATASSAIAAVTIEVPTTGLNFVNQQPLTNQGCLYYWVASTAPDATNTTLASGGDVITIVYD